MNKTFTSLLVLALFFSLYLSLAAVKAETKGDPAAGKEKYDQICASCHGPGGKGDGPAAAALDPKPRDLSDASPMSTYSRQSKRAARQWANHR